MRAYRLLTSGVRARPGPGAPGLIACSGGADSAALAIILSQARVPITIAHIVHDLRPSDQSHADRDRTRALAARLGVPIVEGVARASDRATADGAGNLEAIARRLRYAELVRLAKSASLRFIATAHHADDQLETVLMALCRGAGPRGLAGIAVARRMGGVSVIRPMLHPLGAVTRAEAEEICRQFGYEFAIDPTNADTTRFRAALRHSVLPVLRGLRPESARAATRAAELMRSANTLVEARAIQLLKHTSGVVRASRLALGREPDAVIGEAVRAAHRRLIGPRGLDALSATTLASFIRAVRDSHSEVRHFNLGGLRAMVQAGAPEQEDGFVRFERRRDR